jgi:hypothetical protein
MWVAFSLGAGPRIAPASDERIAAMSRHTEEPFQLEEATIDDLHQAIRDGRTTCVAVVQHYVERVRAYNGV